MSASEPATPFTNMANLILALLTPMFLWSTNGDIRLAYSAAAQTVNEYRITNRLSLFTVAKIIAFDIATLSSLSQSAYEDVSVLLALRLRGNANSLDRSGERNRRLLEQESRARPADEGDSSARAAVDAAERMAREANARMHADARAPEVQADAGTAEPASPPVAVPETPSAAALPPAYQPPANQPPANQPPAYQPPANQPRADRPDAMTAATEAFPAERMDSPEEERWRERIQALTAAAGDPASAATPPPMPAMAAA